MVFIVIAAALLALAHTAPFPFLLEAQDPGRTLWRMPRRVGSPAIYLTFDDGPNPAATPALLDALSREGVQATFFLIPEWVTPETAPIVARIVDEGHGIGLHSRDRWLMLKPPDEIRAAITGAADHIEALAGTRPCSVFRPHGGWRSGSMYRALADLDHQLTGWSMLAWDWNWFRRRTPASIVARLAGRASDGLIVVMHDGHHLEERADRRYASEAVAALVPKLRRRGFQFRNLCADLDAANGRREAPPVATH
jgi:peptidoglycan/xylan/chitin deacetylase (PgdA/CDA1 family)